MVGGAWVGVAAVLAALGCGGGTFEGDDAGECSDAADNDRDGLFDCDDPDCSASPACRAGDAGAVDAGGMDASEPADAGGMDASEPADAGGMDASEPADASRTDAGERSDAAAMDAGEAPDAASDSGGALDAASDSAALSDAGPLPTFSFHLDAMTAAEPDVSVTALGSCLDVSGAANSLLEPGEHAIRLVDFDPRRTTQMLEWIEDPWCDASGCGTYAFSTVRATMATLSSAPGEVCLSPIAGATRPGYVPNVPAHPCFASAPTDLTVVTSQDDIPLTAARFAATMDPSGTLTSGLLYGFVSEETARTIEFVLGGVRRTLWELLPGGGGCLGTDARDTHGGVSGWWLHFHFSAVDASP